MAALALLWPSRLTGLLDGVPLDRPVEAIAVGVVFPALWLAFPRFAASRFARAAIVTLLALKVILAATTVQDGWCVRFEPARPFVKDQTGAPHAWDVRADWRSPDPRCSAIETRSYDAFADFPAWFFNLPPASDSWPGPADRPPGATTRMTVSGSLAAPATGDLRIDLGPDMAAAAAVDGQRAPSTGGTIGPVTLTRGTHRIDVDVTLTGYHWRFVPLWNGGDLWSRAIATVHRPTPFDRAIRAWAASLVTLVAAALLAGWILAAVRELDDPDAVAWAAGASGWLGVLAVTGHGEVVRWSVPCLAGAMLLPVARRPRSGTRAFVLLGVPWLAMLVCLTAGEIGRFRLYDWGNDYWTFQRAAYRIVMQGYWLEGGSATFWFQPFYRWCAGLLHVVFGDSSVGEVYWDAAWTFVGALFAFRVTRAFAGPRWGIAAAVLTLSVWTLSSPWQQIGFGLSETTSAGFVYAAALLTLAARGRRWTGAIPAGLLAALGFYTRLNNLPMAFGVAVFALPPVLPVRGLRRLDGALRRTWWPAATTVVASVIAALVLFAARTWYYTGVFSVTYGTQATLLALWQPGMRPWVVLERMASSVMMVLTLNDPPRFDLHALPLLAGAACALLALAGVPRLRNIPASTALFAIASVSGALVARGSAYPGRFSIHVIPVMCATAVCATAALAGIRANTTGRVGLQARPARTFRPASPIRS